MILNVQNCKSSEVKVFHQVLVAFRFKLVSTTLKLLGNKVLWGFGKNWTQIHRYITEVLFLLQRKTVLNHILPWEDMTVLTKKNWLFITISSSAECREKFTKQHEQTVLVFWSFSELETKFWTTKFTNFTFPFWWI